MVAAQSFRARYLISDVSSLKPEGHFLPSILYILKEPTTQFWSKDFMCGTLYPRMNIFSPFQSGRRCTGRLQRAETLAPKRP